MGNKQHLPEAARGNEAQAELILRSYHALTGRDLVAGWQQATSYASLLYHAPLVVLSHGTEADPVLNYGNAAALQAWEMDWAVFTRTPSRYTAEPVERSEREAFLQAVAARGYVDNYSGIRISSTGRRFRISNATVWNLVDSSGAVHGQAAAVSQYSYVAEDCEE